VKQEAWISTGRWVGRSTTRGGDTGVVRGGATAGGESVRRRREGGGCGGKGGGEGEGEGGCTAEDRAKKRAAPAKKTAKDGRCEHGRERRFCKDCGSSGLCEQHGRRRDRCKHCGGSAASASTGGCAARARSAAAAASASTGGGATSARTTAARGPKRIRRRRQRLRSRLWPHWRARLHSASASGCASGGV
jgi:hypothetical protein